MKWKRKLNFIGDLRYKAFYEDHSPGAIVSRLSSCLSLVGFCFECPLPGGAVCIIVCF